MKGNDRLYVDIHVLQTVPPSCVNRDDTGAPKTAVYGGTTRARVSSQSWKRAVRMMFMEMLPETEVGIRTKSVPALLTKAIAARDPAVKAEDLALKVLKDAGVSYKKEKKDTEYKTKALFFISQAQVDALATFALAGDWNKEQLQQGLRNQPTLDVALFGRMVASDHSSLNTDATCQVAHAISTHTVHNEYDYFTAVDDCAPEENTGAGHLGTVEYNSSTLYRYATINATDLQEKLGKDTAQVVRLFAEAFVRTMPTGKQNTFANRTLPDVVYIALRSDQPVNLAGAFEQPVAPSAEGYAARSAARLTAYVTQLCNTFVQAPDSAYVTAMVPVDGLEAQAMPLQSTLAALEEDVSARLSVNEVM